MMRVAEQTACDQPAVSVAMNAYNCEQFVAQAIESVLMQETTSVVELVIGEDCSTDSTRRIVQAYGAKYPNVIRVLLPEKNLGISRNYEAVWHACGGKYIAWLDGDDYWRTPQKLQKQVALMETNPHYSMCGTKTQFVTTSSDGAEKDAGVLEPAMLKPEYDLPDFLTGYPMHTSSMLGRRELVALPDWLNDAGILWDACAFALYAEKGPVGYLNEVMSCWRIHGGGMWTTRSTAGQLQCNQNAIDLLDAHFGGRYHRLLRSREYQVWRTSFRSLAERGEYREARRLYWESASRLVRLMPLKVLALGCAAHGGYWCVNHWNQLTMSLATRTRLRRLLGRVRPAAMELGDHVDGIRAEQGYRVPPISLREAVLSILPAPVHSAVRPWWRRFFRFKLRLRDWWLPFIVWIVWLVFQCIRYRKRAVVVCRFGGIGDVICVLPMCDEVRRQHCGKLLVFVTSAVWRDVVMLSRSADLVYANRSWVHPFTLPTQLKLFGLVDAIYNPQTTGELTGNGEDCHLIEDLAASCGFDITARQPCLYPSPSLIKKTRIAYGLAEDMIGNRLVIGINAGPSWRVREWEVSKWQNLINKIHSEYDAVIIQFGGKPGNGACEYDHLKGVQSPQRRLQGAEGVALIAICDLIITIDSGPVHLAGAVGTPVIGLFGCVNPALRLPPASPALGLTSDVPCLYCHHQTPHGHWFDGCPNDIACMQKLDDQTVFDAVKFMLGQNNKRQVKESLAVSD